MAGTEPPPAAADETTTLAAQCYCKAVHFTLTVPTASLPLSAHLCHCSICRWTHGTLCIFHAPVPRGPPCIFMARDAPPPPGPSTAVTAGWVAPSGPGQLTGYRPPNDDGGGGSKPNGTRFFCSACGCHVGAGPLDKEEEDRDPSWVVASSLFPQDRGAFRIGAHCCTLSAGPDGGLVDWLPRIGDREMRVWNPPEEAAAAAAAAEETGQGQGQRDEQQKGGKEEEELLAECHCGGVSFRVRRPTGAEAADPKLRRFVSPVDPQKWIACLDMCDDCRLTSGTHVIGWAFVTVSAITPSPPPPPSSSLSSPSSSSSPPPRVTGVAADELRVLGRTLRVFESSAGARRGFCGTCGATVFYACDDRPTLLDVAVGLLHAPEGPRAEAWLTWRAGRLAWEASGLRYDEAFTRALRDGFRDWSLAAHGHALTGEV